MPSREAPGIGASPRRELGVVRGVETERLDPDVDRMMRPLCW